MKRLQKIISFLKRFLPTTIKLSKKLLEDQGFVVLTRQEYNDLTEINKRLNTNLA